MKNTFLLLFLSITSFLSAQNSYKFPASTQIYDLDGGNFLSHYISNNKAYLQERDSTGAILWQDSIVGTSDNPLNLASMQLERFGTSNTYAVFLLDKFVNDSTLVNFTKLSLQNHTLSELKNVKLPLHRLLTSQLSNESITLMSGKYNVFDRVVSHDVFNLDNKLSLIKQSQNSFNSLPTINSKYNLLLNGSDGLTEIYSHYGDFYSKTYDANFSTLRLDSARVTDPYLYCDVLSVLKKGVDSLFMFHYCYDSGGDKNKSTWVFSWLDKQLNELSSQSFVFNNTEVNQEKFGLASNQVVFASDKVYLLGAGRDEKANLNNKMFIYDQHFERICEFDVTNGTRVNNTLITFNDNAYVKRVVGNEMQLTRINNCALATGIGNTDGVSPTSSIYPNPNNGKFVLKTAQNVQGKTATVYNILGKKLAEFKLNNAFEHSLSFELEPGVYFLKIASERASIKFIVQ